MPYAVVEFRPTPNPNSMKCVLDREAVAGIRSYRSPDDPREGDPLADALFAVDGVTGLLFNGDWVAVNKHPDAAWPAVKEGVRRALADAP